MKLSCIVCKEPATGGWRWRGYYRFRCVNGHRFKIATPEQAARNWARNLQASRRAEQS